MSICTKIIISFSGYSYDPANVSQEQISLVSDFLRDTGNLYLSPKQTLDEIEILQPGMHYSKCSYMACLTPNFNQKMKMEC